MRLESPVNRTCAGRDRSIVIGLCLLLATPAGAQTSEPLECVYQATDQATLFAAEQASRSSSTATPEQRVAHDLVADLVWRCMQQNNWTIEQATSAATYAIGRAHYELAVHALNEANVDAGIIEQIALRLTEEQIESAFAGHIEALMPVFAAVIPSSRLVQLPSDQARPLARLVGAGVIGLLSQRRAREAFARH